MPIYEFKCLKCNDCFEILFTSTQEEVELKCSKCSSLEVERVLSSHSAVSSTKSSAGGVASSQTRSCSSGSCTTYDIPGPR